MFSASLNTVTQSLFQTTVLGITLYELSYYFFIYSVLGWIMETIFCSVKEKKLVDRGFLIGPYCPIYGTGMTLIIICLNPFAEWPLVIYAGGALIATVLEYVTSWAMEKLFHAKWWDYSDCKFNLHGRICLRISLIWGCLSLIIIEVLHPFTASLVKKIPLNIGTIILTIFIIVILLDLVHSVITAAKLSKRLRSLEEIKISLRDLYEKSKWAENAEQLRKRLENYSIAQLITDLNNHLKENIQEQKEKHENRLKQLKEKYSTISKPKFFERRMINAFPTMRSKHSKNIKREISKDKKTDNSD